MSTAHKRVWLLERTIGQHNSEKESLHKQNSINIGRSGEKFSNLIGKEVADDALITRYCTIGTVELWQFLL